MSGVILASIKIESSAPWITPLLKFIQGFKPGTAQSNHIMRQLMIYGLLQPMRSMFLGKIKEALLTQLAGAGNTDLPTTEQRRNKILDIGDKLSSLKLAYEAVDTAVSERNKESLAQARKRVKAAQEALSGLAEESDNAARSEQRSNTEKKRISLGALTSGLMRSRALKVLDLLTNPDNVTTTTSAEGQTWSVGSVGALDQVKTPSATAILLRRQTDSHKAILWRHLEFGTGALASKAKVAGLAMNTSESKHKNRDGTWYFGRSESMPDAGIKIRGSSPMSVLWGENSLVPDDYTVEITKTLERVMGQLEPRIS